MSKDSERMPLTPSERRWEESLTADLENQNIALLEQFLSFQDTFIEKMQLLGAAHVTQETVDECEDALIDAGHQFALAVQSESNFEDQAAYAVELVNHTVLTINKNCIDQQQRAPLETIDQEDEMIQKMLSVHLASGTPKDGFAVLDQFYDKICQGFIVELYVRDRYE